MMEVSEERFAQLKEQIRRQYGEDAQKALLESAFEQSVKGAETALPRSAYEEIRKRIGLDVNTTTAKEKCLKLLHNSARARVLLVADRVERYEQDITGLRLDAPKMIVPNDRKWGFKLGDNVRVKGSLEEFASLQKATLGWTGRLKGMHGQTGYVQSIMSDYDNAVHVCFPETGAKCALYAGALEKIEATVLSKKYLKWKVGEFVQTQKDLKLISIIQGNLLPTGKRGQIVGFATGNVLVTFDNQTVHEVNPAILIRSSKVENVVNTNKPQTDGFQVGQKAKVLNNIKMLIDNQNAQMTSGRWSESMSSLRGKQVTILNVNELGGLNVQCEGGRPWKISSSSVIRLNQEEGSASDLEFTIADVVTVKIPPDIRSILKKARISLAFIEYLRLTAEVAAVGGDYQPYVRFWNWKRQTEFNSALLRKPGSLEKVKIYQDIKKKSESLKAGDIVCLDVGPPNFAAEVLKSAGRDDSIVIALTNSSTLKGYLDNNFAVIEYEDGTRYKVKKRLLTIPERFHIEGPEKEVDLEVSHRIVQAIEEATRHITRQEKAIKAFNVSSGNPPSIKITTYSPVSHEDVTMWLQQNRDWRIKMQYKGQILICSDDFGNVNVGISFGEEIGERNTGASEIVSECKEKGYYEVQAQSFVDGPPADKELDRVMRRYLRFCDPALGRDIYFPYVLHGPPRTPMATQNAEREAGNMQTRNTYYIINSQVSNISNTSLQGGN